MVVGGCGLGVGMGVGGWVGGGERPASAATRARPRPMTHPRCRRRRRSASPSPPGCPQAPASASRPLALEMMRWWWWWWCVKQWVGRSVASQVMEHGGGRRFKVGVKPPPPTRTLDVIAPHGPRQGHHGQQQAASQHAHGCPVVEWWGGVGRCEGEFGLLAREDDRPICCKQAQSERGSADLGWVG